MKEISNMVDTTKSAEQMIQDMLADYRKARGFDVTKYIKLKGRAINKFFRDNKLDAAVVGISGGVDSAVVYRLLRYASLEANSPIKRITGVLMPIHCPGTTGQSDALRRGLKVVEIDDVMNYYVDDLTEACKSYVDNTRTYVEHVEEHPAQVTCSQMKEKFGSLRFYTNGNDDQVEGMIDMAELMCDNTCEVCGTHENLGYTQGWISVRCEKCKGAAKNEGEGVSLEMYQSLHNKAIENFDKARKLQETIMIHLHKNYCVQIFCVTNDGTFLNSLDWKVVSKKNEIITDLEKHIIQELGEEYNPQLYQVVNEILYAFKKMLISKIK